MSPATAYELSKVDDLSAQADLANAVVTEGLSRAETVEMVRAIKARRPVSKTTARPEPVTLDLGVGVVVVKWKRGGESLTPEQLLRRALKNLAGKDGRAA